MNENEVVETTSKFKTLLANKKALVGGIAVGVLVVVAAVLVKGQLVVETEVTVEPEA